MLKNLIMSTMDPGVSKNITPLPADQVVKDWELSLVPKRQVKVSDIIKNGPLLLTFIRGTWCPFCSIHLKNLRSWVEKLENKKATIIVASSEQEHKIQEWLAKNPVPYIFASDNQFELAQYFGVHTPGKPYFQAATFVIDVNATILLAYSGKRTNKNFDEIGKHIS